MTKMNPINPVYFPFNIKSPATLTTSMAVAIAPTKNQDVSLFTEINKKMDFSTTLKFQEKI